ncbi:UNVERIFIED_ORG: hypothetical protein C0V67_01555 [Anaplasma ovis]
MQRTLTALSILRRCSGGTTNSSCGGIVVSWAEVPGVEGTRSWEMLVTVEVNRCRELCVVGMSRTVVKGLGAMPQQQQPFPPYSGH